MLECFKGWWRDFSKHRRQPGESSHVHVATLCIALVMVLGIPVAFLIHYLFKLMGLKGLFQD